MKKGEAQRGDDQLMGLVIERMKALRSKHGYSQEQVFEQTKLNISQYESGRNYPSLVSLTALCQFYNITLDEFFAPMKYPSKNNEK